MSLATPQKSHINIHFQRNETCTKAKEQKHNKSRKLLLKSLPLVKLQNGIFAQKANSNWTDETSLATTKVQNFGRKNSEIGFGLSAKAVINCALIGMIRAMVTF